MCLAFTVTLARVGRQHHLESSSGRTRAATDVSYSKLLHCFTTGTGHVTRHTLSSLVFDTVRMHYRNEAR